MKQIITKIKLVFIFVLIVNTIDAQVLVSQGKLTQTYGNINVGGGASPELADIDGDGDLDLFIGCGHISIFLNDGSGIYSSAGNLQADGSDIYCINPVFADVDNDGDLDLYTGNDYGTIGVYLNNGNGLFSFLENMQADGVTIDVGDMSSPVFADIDGDNDLDLYVGNHVANSQPYHGYVSIYINDGTNTFSYAGKLQADGDDIDVGFYGMANPEFADIDNDNDLDLIINSQNKIKVFFNDGNGNFSLDGFLQADDTDIVVQDARCNLEDIDNDGDLDLYVGNYPGNVLAYLNNGDGTFTYSQYVKAYETIIYAGSRSCPAFADIDEDGDMDLYVGSDWGKISIYLNDGNGLFTPNGFLQADGSVIDIGIYSTPEFADIDEDGDMDLYVGNYNANIKVFINDGNGTFSASGSMQADGVPIDVGFQFATPAFADIDEDGDMDLYVGNYDGYIKVFINDGNGIFSASGNLQADGIEINVGMYYADPEFADIDKDGDLDLYVGTHSGKIKVYLNDGTGVFNYLGDLQHFIGTVYVAYWASPVFADYDLDGDLDLFVGQYNSSHINYFINENLPHITFHPEDQLDICGNSIVEFSIISDFTDNYQWQKKEYNGTEFVNIIDGDIYSGSQTNTLSVNADVSSNNYQYRCIAANFYGNQISDTAILILELEDPQLTVQNIEIELDVSGSAILTPSNLVTFADDNCSLLDTTVSQSTFNCSEQGSNINVEVTLTDISGNFTTQTSVVSVIDNISPTFSCPDNQEVTADETNTYLVQGSEFDPTEIADNCGISNIENNYNNASTLDGVSLPEGTTTIIWSITDNSGNTSNCSFNILVNEYVGVENIHYNGISIYPNPSNGIINFEFANTNIKKLTISDITGKKIIKKTTIEQKGIIDLSSFVSGIYIISIQTDNEIFKTKIVKR